MLNGRFRWLGVFAGLVVAAVDTFSASAYGVRFQLNDVDVTTWVFLYFGSSFAILGYIAGYTIEARRRLKAQHDLIQEAQVRLAQNDKLAMLGQLAGAIAHEVRNPLAIIRSSVQNLNETIPDADLESKKSCTFVIEEIDRLTRVSASLLGFVRPLRVNTERVLVGDVFDRTELLAGSILQKKNMRLVRTGVEQLPEVAGDPDLMCQALLGLVANAVDAAPERTDVALEACKVGDEEIEIAVSDRGPGIAPELRTKIFEPFFTTRSEGHGLGLAVVKQIVESHGGRIDVGERPGGGARFSMRFPTRRAA